MKKRKSIIWNKIKNECAYGKQGFFLHVLVLSGRMKSGLNAYKKI